MRPTLRITIAILILTTPALAESPSAADFDAQLAKLTPKASKDERVQVAKWVRTNFASEHAPKVIPALEQLIQKDPEGDVRREAVAALMQIVNRHDVPTPLGLVVAMGDSVDEVRWETMVFVGPYKRKLAPGVLDALIAGTTDKRPEVRANSLIFLSHAAGKDAKARAAIEKAKEEKNFQVQHTAHCAWFTATDSVADFLAYIIRIRDDADSVLEPLPKDSDEAKKQLTMRNLFSLGGAMRVVEWSSQRPDELAAALIKLLDDKSAPMRRGAADLIGASAKLVELKRDEAKFGINIEPLVPELNPKPKDAKEKPEQPMPSKTYPKLMERKAIERLRYVATMDEDLTVRAAARLALERIAELPEPLQVKPREVRP
jgi:hypothetical protein